MEVEDEKDKFPYRKNVAAIIVNFEKKILMCEHIWIDNSWQFPQGGIDEGEAPEESLFRELYEELGVKEFKIIAKADKTFKYEFPQYLKDRYKSSGQEQLYFLLYFYGDDSKIRFDLQINPEFQSFQWVDYDQPPKKVIYFKKKTYQEALDYFRPIFEKIDTEKLEKEIKKEKREKKEDYLKYLDLSKAHLKKNIK